ncbi:MAG: alpha/beta hydrolase, partial [Bacteroidota bacterium]
MKKGLIWLLLFCSLPHLSAQQWGKNFTFGYNGVVLDGVLNLPEQSPPRGIVLIVHGSGRTNAVAQNLHGDVRAAIVAAGYGTYMWDKMGCGKSGGVFDYNQTVASSAAEVIAAITALRAHRIPGAETIGLWGISRAGWINPLVIAQFPGIKFWISVSGVDDQENFGYLLEQNLLITGLPRDSVDQIVAEWHQGVRITHRGGTYEEFLAATPSMRANAFLDRFNNGRKITAAGYYAYQKGFMPESLDETTGLQVYVDNFATILSQVEVPVLALFGEKDKNVD